MFADENLRDMLYIYVGNIGQLVVLIYSICMIKAKRNRMSMLSVGFHHDKIVKKGLLKDTPMDTWRVVVEIVLFWVFEYYFVGLYNTAFGKIVGTGANYFGLMIIMPVVVTAFCLVVWMNPMHQFDMFAVPLPGALVFVKLACALAGCCHGAAWEGGLYNYEYGRNEINSALIEMALALVIFVFILWYKKRAKPGTVFPVYMIVYSATRFFSEFTRGEDNVLWIFKRYHFCCIAGVIVGCIYLFIALKYGDRIDEYFREHTYFKKGAFHKERLKAESRA